MINAGFPFGSSWHLPSFTINRDPYTLLPANMKCTNPQTGSARAESETPAKSVVGFGANRQTPLNQPKKTLKPVYKPSGRPGGPAQVTAAQIPWALTTRTTYHMHLMAPLFSQAPRVEFDEPKAASSAMEKPAEGPNFTVQTQSNSPLLQGTKS